MDGHGIARSVGSVVPMRRALAASGAALLLAAATVLGAGVYAVAYLALDGERPSVDMVLRLAPRLRCAVLRECSP